jgi:hypothetical protein
MDWGPSLSRYRVREDAGDFDPDKKVVEQRCAMPGSNLGVRLEMGLDGWLRPSADSGEASDLGELHKMLNGGNRNSRTQPVGPPKPPSNPPCSQQYDLILGLLQSKLGVCSPESCSTVGRTFLLRFLSTV